MPRKDKGRSALADIPKGPFLEVFADQSGYDRCIHSLVRYFRGKKGTIESPEDSAHEVLARAAEISPENTQHCLAWLASRYFIDDWRKQKRRPAKQTVRLDQLPSLRNSLESAEQRELHEALRAAVDRLPDQIRVVVLLHYFDDYRLVAIADMLGIDRHTVENRLKRARKAMRAMLGGFSE